MPTSSPLTLLTGFLAPPFVATANLAERHTQWLEQAFQDLDSHEKMWLSDPWGRLWPLYPDPTQVAAFRKHLFQALHEQAQHSGHHVEAEQLLEVARHGAHGMTHPELPHPLEIWWHAAEPALHRQRVAWEWLWCLNSLGTQQSLFLHVQTVTHHAYDKPETSLVFRASIVDVSPSHYTRVSLPSWVKPPSGWNGDLWSSSENAVFPSRRERLVHETQQLLKEADWQWLGSQKTKTNHHSYQHHYMRTMAGLQGMLRFVTFLGRLSWWTPANLAQLEAHALQEAWEQTIPGTISLFPTPVSARERF